jgi:hypothetical protein
MAMVGKDVCMMHGGKTPRGRASANYKHGGYSKALPERLAARYEAAAGDPELLAMRGDIALTVARLYDLLKRVDTGESGSAWREAGDGLTQFLESNGDAAKAAEGLARLKSAIGRGRADYAAWDEVKSTLETRRKLIESERKRLVDMQQIITAEQALALIGQVVEIVSRHTRPEQLTRISTDITALIARGGAQPTRGAGADESEARAVALT